MPLTIVVADDDFDYRLLVRALLRPMSATMSWSVRRPMVRRPSRLCSASGPTSWSLT
jgi:hypothetical protein